MTGDTKSGIDANARSGGTTNVVEVRGYSAGYGAAGNGAAGNGAAGSGNAGSKAPEETLRETVEKSIQYIIKVEQPKEGATLTATGKNNAALAKSHDYSVAKEGEEVYLRVDLQKGFQITGALFTDTTTPDGYRVDASGART